MDGWPLTNDNSAVLTSETGKQGGAMPFTGVILFDEEPQRECWHEAGHAIVAHHLGMTVLAIGFSWVRGESHAPNPSCWIPTDGFDKESVAIQLFGGVAAEIVKLGDYDTGASHSDVLAWQELGYGSSSEQFINQAIKILNEKDDGLLRVYNRLMEERTKASREPFVDSDDRIKKQVHLTREEFESLL